MKYQTILFILLLSVNNTVFAVTTYTPYNSPTQYMELGNPYNAGMNPYSTQDNNNPYSVFQNPYHTESARNSEKYEQRIYNTQGEFQGNISIQTTYPNAVTNPYGLGGNEYNEQNALYNYNPKNAKYPHNIFQQPYSNESVYNNPKYSTQLTGNDKHSMGALQPPSYNDKESALNPYGSKGNIFNSGNASDPYYIYHYLDTPNLDDQAQE